MSVTISNKRSIYRGYRGVVMPKASIDYPKLRLELSKLGLNQIYLQMRA